MTCNKLGIMISYSSKKPHVLKRGTSMVWVPCAFTFLFGRTEPQMHDNFTLSCLPCLLWFLFLVLSKSFSFLYLWHTHIYSLLRCIYLHTQLMMLNLVHGFISTENNSSSSGMRPPTLNIFPSQPMHVEPSSSNSKVIITSIDPLSLSIVLDAILPFCRHQ